MKKATRSEEQSSPRKANSNPTIRRLSPREARLLGALLRHPEGLSREQTDKAAPASNGPHYIGLLRQKLGLLIPCRRVDFVTKDGEPSWYGLYFLSGEDREKLAKLGVE